MQVDTCGLGNIFSKCTTYRFKQCYIPTVQLEHETIRMNIDQKELNTKEHLYQVRKQVVIVEIRIVVIF